MNIIGQLDPSAFRSEHRLHHREDEVAAEFPSSVGSRRRNLVGLKCQNWRAGGSPTPPWDYQVEYLEYGNRAFFNTGIIPSVGGTGIVVDVSISLVPNDSGAIAGVCSSGLFAAKQSFSVYAEYNRDGYVTDFIHAYGGYSIIHPNFPMKERIRIEMNYLGSGKVVVGSYMETDSLIATAVQQSPIYLCGLNVADSTNRNFYTNGLLYGAKLSEGRKVVGDYTPCVKDGIPALYDAVSGDFLYNGYPGGTVIAGPRI